jgi:hypothetical protein
MRGLTLVLTILLVAPAPLLAGEAPGGTAPRRGIADGRFVDDYFGVVYATAGPTEGFSVGGPTVIFSGKARAT